MKRFIIGLTAASVLGLVGVARADDTPAPESKTTTKKTEKKATQTPKDTTDKSALPKDTDQSKGEVMKNEKSAPTPAQPDTAK